MTDSQEPQASGTIKALRFMTQRDVWCTIARAGSSEINMRSCSTIHNRANKMACSCVVSINLEYNEILIKKAFQCYISAQAYN